MKPSPNSVVHKLEKWFREIIIAMMKREGRNFAECELCLEPIINGFDLHHMRYEDATYYDLRIACRRCNTQSVNKGLP